MVTVVSGAPRREAEGSRRQVGGCQSSGGWRCPYCTGMNFLPPGNAVQTLASPEAPLHTGAVKALGRAGEGEFGGGGGRAGGWAKTDDLAISKCRVSLHFASSGLLESNAFCVELPPEKLKVLCLPISHIKAKGMGGMWWGGLWSKAMG